MDDVKVKLERNVDKERTVRSDENNLLGKERKHRLKGQE